MRIRNLRKFDIYLPYAGDKGMRVKAAGLSQELPSDRFYNPGLQRDWKRGYIELLLSDMDKAVLGSAIAAYDSTPVSVKVARPRPTAGAKRSKPEPITPDQPVYNEDPENEPYKTSVPVLDLDADDAGEAPEPAKKPQQASIKKASTKKASTKKVSDKEATDKEATDKEAAVEDADMGGVTVGTAGCVAPACTHPDDDVRIDSRIGVYLCKYCRMLITRWVNSSIKSGEASSQEAALQYASTRLGLACEPTVVTDTQDTVPDTIPATGYGLRLADLNR